MFYHRQGKSGFTLIELAIVLGITGILFTGLWRLLSNGNEQLRDQATASQQQQLITAISIYLTTAEGQNWMANNLGTASPGPALLKPALLPLPVNAAGSAACTTGGYTNPGLCTILPPGFEGPAGTTPTVNPYGQTYAVRVLAATITGTPPQSYSFMILTSGGDPISDTDGGRISSMIGGDGGFIYSNPTCTAATSFATACGSYGAWSSTVGTYGFATPGNGGYVASRTYYTPSQNSLQPWLARVVMPGDNTNYNYNTMVTDFYAGVQNALNPAGTPATLQEPVNINLAPYPQVAGLTGGNINMGGINYTTAGTVPPTGEVPATTGGGNINMANGTINMVSPNWTYANNGAAAGAINMNGGTINMQGGVNGTTPYGVINLQGGEISDVSLNPAISIQTGSAYDGGGTQPPNGLITVGTGCSVDAIGLFGGTADPTCGFGILVVGDESVDGRLNANSLYAQTFIYQGSDMRLKKNIRAMQNPLDDIMKVKPVSFTFKATGQDSLGVIAQDIEKIYPQLVAVRGDGMKSVNYEGLIAPLIGAVQELKKENDDLRDQLKAQALREDRLEQELKKQP